ncbi:hypothetical protein HMH01_05665 [Halovulum dunhuangense]|uniref:Uncharacterized protein n=1 Tax=Halovulum dunhuangense TaxID=1505036 RepID=A0A849L0W9_9RHOB|nr:hypothetical protein [Halovulum dunhuangense]NNU79922.1 hypothetical protein [Halovulum dunhuangense]
MIRASALTIAALCMMAPPLAAQSRIEVIPYDDIAVPPGTQIDFEGLSVHSDRGLMPVDGLLVLKGVALGERFEGQGAGTRISPEGIAHDRILERPTAPLAVEPGPRGGNLAIAQSDPAFGSSVLLPTGPGAADGDADHRHGEGAVALRFDQDQCMLGFAVYLDGLGGTVAALEAGWNLRVTFYDRDGRILGEMSQLRSGGLQTAAYRDRSGVPMIAGAMIENLDIGGIALDDLRFSAYCTPLLS